MDATAVVESMDLSVARSESLGEKRPLENGVESDLANKKAREGDDVRLAVDVKKVAEMVLVLATMGKVRAGRKPTPEEVKMMAEAREKLAEVCKEFAPKDIFPRDAFGTVIEDLGLSRLREQRLGVRPPKMSIAQKLQLTKQKMEKSEVFPVHSTTCTPQRLQSNLSGVAENHGKSHAVRIFPSDKANNAPISSGGFQHPSKVVHASTANSRTLPYQLPTSEVRPVVSNISSNLGRGAERPHLRLDGRSNGSSQANSAGKTPTWSMQSQSASYAKVGSDKVHVHNSVKAEGSDATTSRMPNQAIMSRPFTTQTTPSNPMNINQHRGNFVHAPSAADTHNEICKIVQKLLQPHLPQYPTWTPPSRDYMNKALTCQICKGTINEVDTALVCDACEKGYHLRCLQCNPKAIPRGEWHEWHCTKCLEFSNGKPLPPKYGRVMRNISTPKLSSSGGAVPSSLEKKEQSSDENVNQHGNSGSQSDPSGNLGNNNKFTDMQIDENECGNAKSPSEICLSNSDERPHENKLASMSESRHRENSEVVTSSSDHLRALANHQDHSQNKLSSITQTLSNQSQASNPLAKFPEKSHNQEKLNHPGSEIVEDEQSNLAKTSEKACTAVGEHEGSSYSISGSDVEWVGGILKEVDGRTYYQSCCVNGTVYKVQDYALFSSNGNKYMPNKLQVMWEDSKTSKKWVTVTRCFFPDDLPEGVGRPCAPESNEVYESNHESTLMAGLIHGPCEVLPPSKFSKGSVVQTRLRSRASDRPKPLFLCKWFYDETKRLFRDVTC